MLHNDHFPILISPANRLSRFSSIPSPSALVLVAWAMGLAVSISGAAEMLSSEPILDIKTSPDGRFVAIAYPLGELGVLDLDYIGPIQIYTRHLDQGFAWAPDSRTITFFERFPSQPPQLWLARAAEAERLAKPVVSGNDWKAFPCWIAPGQIAYLTEKESDHLNVWEADTQTTGTRRLLDLGMDVTGLWRAPKPGDFIYRSDQSGKPELWLSRFNPEELLQLTRDPEEETYFEDKVALSPSGQYLAFLARGNQVNRLVYFDLDRRREIAAAIVESPPDSIEFASDRELLLVLGSRLLRWTPGAPRGKVFSRGQNWQGLGISRAAPLGDRGWAAVANENLLVTGVSLEKLDQGRLHARRPEDLLGMILRWQAVGENRKARAMLAELWERRRASVDQGVAVAAAGASVEAARANPRGAEDWLDRALKLASPKSPEAEAAWHERMFLRLFDETDRKKTRRLLAQMPEPISQTSRALWVKSLLDSEEDAAIAAWQAIGKALRARKWMECASRLHALVLRDPDYRLTREGTALLLQGDLEPLRMLHPSASSPYPELLNYTHIQEALILLAEHDLSAEMSRKELRGSLLLQWAEAGQYKAARDLVLVDLRDPEGSTLDFADILDRFLDPQELERWMERGAGEALLAKDVQQLLDRQMADTSSHLILLLARARQSIVEGDNKRLAGYLDQLERDLLIVKPDFWKKATAKYLFLIRLYRAKFHERNEEYDKALASYRACQEVISRYPGDWGVSPFDIAMMQELLERGASQGDLLKTFLHALRGLGDPLVNPAHDPATVGVGLSNIATLRLHGAEDWLLPYLEYVEGSALGLIDQPYRALGAFDRAQSAGAGKALAARTMIEEAAVRSSLGQHRLAALLTERLCQLGLDPPRLAFAIRSRVQYENESGLIQSQENRMRFLCGDLKLSYEWSATLVDDNSAPSEE